MYYFPHLQTNTTPIQQITIANETKLIKQQMITLCITLDWILKFNSHVSKTIKYCIIYFF